MHVRRSTALVTALATATVTMAGIAFAQTAPSQGRAATRAPADANAQAADVFVIAFHADWCGKCRVLGPKLLDDVLPEIKADPYLFVKLDMTDRNSNQAEYMLSALGLGALWESHGRKTGFALIVDAKTKQVVRTLRANADASSMVRDVRAALQN